MKKLREDLQAVTKGLKQLAKKTEQLGKRLEKIEKAKSTKAKGPKTKRRPYKKAAVRKTSKTTGIDAVFAVVNSRKKGVTTEQIKVKTGFNERKIWDNINKLKIQGKVKSPGRGRYIAV